MTPKDEMLQKLLKKIIEQMNKIQEFLMSLEKRTSLIEERLHDEEISQGMVYDIKERLPRDKKPE